MARSSSSPPSTHKIPSCRWTRLTRRHKRSTPCTLVWVPTRAFPGICRVKVRGAGLFLSIFADIERIPLSPHMLVRRFRLLLGWGTTPIDSVALRGRRERGERVELIKTTCTGARVLTASQVAVHNDYLCLDRPCQVHAHSRFAYRLLSSTLQAPCSIRYCDGADAATCVDIATRAPFYVTPRSDTFSLDIRFAQSMLAELIVFGALATIYFRWVIGLFQNAIWSVAR